MRVAVVGSGVSGLVAARELSKKHEVVLLEGSDRIGGHTHTVTVMEGERPIPIDTGFIVFNTKTYPSFVRLLGELGVAWTPTEMSFSVRSDRRDFEYNGRDLSSLFSQPSNLLRPSFLRMVADILRFYREGRELLASGGERPLIEWLKERRYSRAFIDDHLMPMVRAVWSANREVAERFPARFLLRFFENHGFLQLTDRPQWLSIPNGARTYVRALLSELRAEVRVGAPVRRVLRDVGGAVTLEIEGAGRERFDHVVLACHSDQALAMLAEPTALEAEVLGAIRYQRNEAVLHTDPALMPRVRRTWAAWNVHLDDGGCDGACVTYWMNELQPLGAAKDYFVTLNNGARIRDEHVLRRVGYAHPIFTLEAARAQERHAEMIDHRGISYAGAYWRNGFHEDGVVSALRVAAALGVPRGLEVAA